MRGWAPRLRRRHSTGILNFIISGVRAQWHILPLSPLSSDEGSEELTSRLPPQSSTHCAFIHICGHYISPYIILDTWMWGGRVYCLYTHAKQEGKCDNAAFNIFSSVEHRHIFLLTHIHKRWKCNTNVWNAPHKLQDSTALLWPCWVSIYITHICKQWGTLELVPGYKQSSF